MRTPLMHADPRVPGTRASVDGGAPVGIDAASLATNPRRPSSAWRRRIGERQVGRGAR